MAVGVAALLGERLLPFESLGRSNYLPVATGVLLERRSHARFTGHGVLPFSQ